MQLMNFQIGEKVVYPNQGVGIVEQISTRNLTGQPEMFYLLKLGSTSMRVMVPLSSVQNVGLRRVTKSSEISAILDYLQKGRPNTQAREIFIRTCAPYRAFQNGSCLHRLISLRLKAAGIEPQGRRGPHAFRHARAISMLQAAVPIKEIGDVLGLRSADSTNTYLELASADLRAVALEIPVEVNA